MLRQRVPLLLVGEPGADPGAGDVVGQEVVGHVGPADRVVLGDARPGHAVELAGLHGDLGVLVGKRHRHHAELGQEAAGGREGVELAVEIGDAVISFLVLKLHGSWPAADEPLPTPLPV
jgi:hypothetical protein